VAEDSKSDAPAYDDPREPRRYSGKVTAIIIVSIVVVFVVLNLLGGHLLSEPPKPAPAPTVTHLSTP
jgi:hypothetical protein